jgi:hypothetical protein
MAQKALLTELDGFSPAASIPSPSQPAQETRSNKPSSTTQSSQPFYEYSSQQQRPVIQMDLGPNVQDGIPRAVFVQSQSKDWHHFLVAGKEAPGTDHILTGREFDPTLAHRLTEHFENMGTILTSHLMCWVPLSIF